MSDETVCVPAADILALADEWDEQATEAEEQERTNISAFKQQFAFMARTNRRHTRRLRALVDAAERPDEGEAADTPREGCPKCGHARHDSLGWCPNIASDNDCSCQWGYPYPAAPVGEPLCKCGHKVGHHFAPRNGECRWCGCKDAQPTPAPLSSPRRTRDEGTEDEAEAWAKWSADTFEYDGTIAHQAFIAGFRAARLAGEDDRP